MSEQTFIGRKREPAAQLASRAESVRVAYPLFQAGGGGSTPTSALQLRLYRVSFPTAKQLVALWHSRLPKLTSPQCRVSYAAEHDGLYYAAAVWSRPIAPNLPQYEWLELQRFAIAPDAPPHTASRLLGVMRRLISSEFPEIVRLVSYQDTEVHSGTIYRAAGWTPTTLSAGDEWDRPNRSRRPVQSKAPKQRWELEVSR